MNTFEKNIAALKKKRNIFYENIKEDIEEFALSESGNYQILEARNKSMYSQYIYGEKVVRYNSNYNPEREAASWAGQYSFPDYKTTVVMFGIAGGYFAKELIKKINDTSIIMLIEPEKDVFIKSLYMYDMTEIINNNNVLLLIGELRDINLSLVLNKFVYWTNVNSMKLIVHPGYDEVYKEQWQLYNDTVENYRISVLVEKNTEHHFGKKFAYNTISNIKHVQDSYYITDFKDKFPENIVGIVVAAGPSLDNNVALLHELKDKAIIFATDTALRRLYKEGITPDFIVTIDPDKDIELFESVDYEKVPVICKMVSNPKALEIQKGVKIWINPSEFERALFNKLGVKIEGFLVGGSVATTAFSICRYIGLKKIVLMGQDLAFKGDASHADGEIRRASEGNNSECYVRGNNGEMIKSRVDWTLYLRWYEKTIRELPEDIEVINATEGGAYIEGTTIMTLKEVYEKYCANCNGVNTIIKEIFEVKHENQKKIIDEFIVECEQDIEIMINELEKAVTLCNRFERKYSKSRVMTPQLINIIKDMTKISKKVREYAIYYTIDDIVKHADVDTIKDIYEKKNDEYEDNMNMVKKAKHIFKLTIDAANDMKQHFKNVWEEN